MQFVGTTAVVDCACSDFFLFNKKMVIFHGLFCVMGVSFAGTTGFASDSAVTLALFLLCLPLLFTVFGSLSSLFLRTRSTH